MNYYKCEQCGGKTEIQGIQSLDNYDCPVVEKTVVCVDCDYAVSKDTLDKKNLLEVCKEVIAEFEDAYGEEITNPHIAPVQLINKLNKYITLANLD